MALADAYDAFLLDLDGVLYRGDVAVPHAPEVVAELRAAGKRLTFLTNNAARTPEQVADKLVGLGFGAEPSEVVTSAMATAALLGDREVRTAFVVGERGVREALSAAGIEVLDGDPSDADVVVVGWDRDADYAKLRTACVLVQRGAHLVATNPDASYPAPDGLLWPGAGALLAVIVTTTGVEPEVVGKPSPPLFRFALERSGGSRPLVVGDRLDTDVAGAVALRWDSLLVLTGVTARADLRSSPVSPTYVAEDLRALTRASRPEASGREATGPDR